ncbi:MAG: hypothetical protein G5663_02410 [Serratia symbiotica]|nr:hypothetical protein [Serratia symbiotica]
MPYSEIAWTRKSSRSPTGRLTTKRPKLEGLQQNAPITRGLLTFWVDETALYAWYCEAKPSVRGRPQHYSDMAVTSVLMLKRIFRLTLRALHSFVDSIFPLIKVSLNYQDTSISKRVKSVNIPFKTPTPGEIAYLFIDFTGFNVLAEEQWKVKTRSGETADLAKTAFGRKYRNTLLPR